MNVLIASVVALCLMAFSSHNAYAQYEEVSYDDLLKELNTKSRASLIRKRPTKDFFGSTQIHAGLGFINSQMGIEVDNESFFRQKSGIQLAVGIDLASPLWQLEGALRNYGQTDNGVEVYSLREFDLRVVYQRRVTPHSGVRMGGGLAARYFDYERTTRSSVTPQLSVSSKPTDGEDNSDLPEGELPAPSRSTETLRVSDSTPSAIAFIGIDYFLADGLSMGIDLNGRASLIHQTADKMAADLTFRIDTHF